MQGLVLYVYLYAYRIFNHKVNAVAAFQALEASGVDFSSYGDIIIDPAKTGAILYDFYSEDYEKFITPSDFRRVFKVHYLAEDYGIDAWFGVPHILSYEDAKHIQRLLANELGEVIFAIPFGETGIIGKQPCYFIKLCEIPVEGKQVPGYALVK